METNQSEKVRQAIFRILELVHGKSDLNEMFRDIKRIIDGLLTEQEKSIPEVGLLLSTIDHDLRTPMCGILGFAELLSEELEEQSAKSKANNILDSARKLMEVLDGMMMVAGDTMKKPDQPHKEMESGPEIIESGKTISPKMGKIGVRTRKLHKSAGKKLPNVLIVEDNLVNIQLLMIYIRRYCNIFSTQNAKSAILLTKDQHFDAILMDINLGPGMDGIQALQEIRKQPGNELIPIIAVTGYATLGDRERFIRDGFTEYVKKPISREEIRIVLERVFQG